jgi:nicotinamidase-related amidase
VYTEQYPRGLGPTDGEILTALPDGVTSMEKNTFSCCDEAAFEELLQGTGRPVPVIFGIETHICVLATVLDLLEKGRKVVLASDACGSRDPLKAERALSAMASAGAMVVPVESVIYHLMGRSGTPEFKELLPLFKE